MQELSFVLLVSKVSFLHKLTCPTQHHSRHTQSTLLWGCRTPMQPPLQHADSFLHCIRSMHSGKQAKQLKKPGKEPESDTETQPS